MTESDRIAHAEQLRLMETLYYPRALPADPVAESNQGEKDEREIQSRWSTSVEEKPSGDGS